MSPGLTGQCMSAGLHRALDSGSISRVGRGRYVIGAVSEHRRRAHGLTGVLSHLSAAVHHGWKVKLVPTEAWITVPRTRHVRGSREGVRLHWAVLSVEELSAGVTSPLRTVLDCARALPFDEAVAVADSALRSGRVSKTALRAAAAAARGLGSSTVRRVARHADHVRSTRSNRSFGRWRSRPVSLRFRATRTRCMPRTGSSGCSGRGSPARSPLPRTIPRPPDARRTCNDTRPGRASGVSGRQ